MPSEGSTPRTRIKMVTVMHNFHRRTRRRRKSTRVIHQQLRRSIPAPIVMNEQRPTIDADNRRPQKVRISPNRLMETTCRKSGAARVLHGDDSLGKRWAKERNIFTEQCCQVPELLEALANFVIGDFVVWVQLREGFVEHLLGEPRRQFASCLS